MNNYEMGQLLTRIQEGDVSAYEVLYSNTYTLCAPSHTLSFTTSPPQKILHKTYFPRSGTIKPPINTAETLMLGCIPSLTMLQWIMSKAENMNLASRNRCSYLLTIRKPLKIL